ncbi:MAG: amidohydrolase family protein [Alphaproteobacteria bacterium]
MTSNLVSPPPGLLQHPFFADGARRPTRQGLLLDVWGYHMQLPHMLALARAVLELPLVVDRVGGPLGIGPFAGRQAEVFPEWKQQMLELAALANVMVKLGGLAMYVTGFDFHRRPRPPGSEELAKIWRPYIETRIEAFGADRCMFESNFPVDKGMWSYPVLWNAFKRLVADAGAEEKAALFSGTARRVYGLARLPEALAFDRRALQSRSIGYADADSQVRQEYDKKLTTLGEVRFRRPTRLTGPPASCFQAFRRAFSCPFMSTELPMSALVRRRRNTVYERRKVDPAFARGWEKAVAMALEALRDAAIVRAQEGTERALWRRGKQVGTIRAYDNRLLMFLLRALQPEVYGRRGH